jgi:hypothetical protein
LVEQGLTRVGQALRLRFSAPLLAALALPNQAMALRGVDQDTIFALELDAPTERVERAEISAIATPSAPDRCTLHVRVALVGREWPDLAGTRVLIRAGAREQELRTDVWGAAQLLDFQRAELADMELEIAPPPS